MVDTYTDNLRLTKPEIDANDDAWEPLLNAGMIALIDEALASESVVDVTAGNVALTENDGATDTSRPMFLRITGTPGVTRTVNTTTASKLYVIKNDSDSSVVIEPSAGTGITVLAGNITMVYVEGATEVFEVATDGSFVAQPSGVMTTLTLDILPTPGAGDTQTTMAYQVQGTWVYFVIDAFDAQNMNGDPVALDNNGAPWPAEILPDTSRQFPVLMQEDTGGGDADQQCNLTISTLDSVAWGLSTVVAGGWTNPSDRSTFTRNIAGCYNKRGN